MWSSKNLSVKVGPMIMLERRLAWYVLPVIERHLLLFAFVREFQPLHRNLLVMKISTILVFDTAY